MAAVHLARLIGPVGFSRTVAIKRLHRHLANDEAFHAMFLDEARLAARVRHPNVVPTLDVVTVDDELFLVMEYVQGESLSKLQRAVIAANGRIPLRIASAIIIATLHGLHAAHEAKSEGGEPLGIVHRDVSPQNIIVGADGVVRVFDFGIAKAMGRLHTTRDGEVKGKAAYMAPEQLRAGAVDARTDVYATAVVLWEVLTGERLFAGDSPEATMNMVLERTPPAPSSRNSEVPEALDALVLCGLARDRRERFGSAREMARELEAIVAPATANEVAEWVEQTSGEALRRRASVIAEIESQPALLDESDASAPPSSARSFVRPASTSTAVTMTDPTPPRRRRANVLTYVAFGVAAVAVAVASWTVLAVRRPGDGAAAAIAASSAAMPSPSPSTADPSPSPSPSPTASASAPAPASASAPTPASALAEGRRPPTVARPTTGAPGRKPARGTNAASRKCDPPYVIDANGDRSPKPECL